jgi:hypothetical protein
VTIQDGDLVIPILAADGTLVALPVQTASADGDLLIPVMCADDVRAAVKIATMDSDGDVGMPALAADNVKVGIRFILYWKLWSKEGVIFGYNINACMPFVVYNVAENSIVLKSSGKVSPPAHSVNLHDGTTSEVIATLTTYFGLTDQQKVLAIGSYIYSFGNGKMTKINAADGTIVFSVTHSGHAESFGCNGTNICFVETSYDHLHAYIYSCTDGSLLNTYSSAVLGGSDSYGGAPLVSESGAGFLVLIQSSNLRRGYLTSSGWVLDPKDDSGLTGHAYSNPTHHCVLVETSEGYVLDVTKYDSAYIQVGSFADGGITGSLADISNTGHLLNVIPIPGAAAFAATLETAYPYTLQGTVRWNRGDSSFTTLNADYALVGSWKSDGSTPRGLALKISDWNGSWVGRSYPYYVMNLTDGSVVKLQAESA